MKEMLSSQIFWLNTGLVIWVVLCSFAASSFKGADMRIEKALVYLSAVGVFISLIRLVFIGISIQWWWPFVILVASTLIGGFIFSIIRGLLLQFLAIAGFIGIPVIWWLGGQF